MRCFTLLSILFFTATTPAWGAAAADCPYDADYLSQQIGQKMQVVTQMKGLLGPACEYADDKREIKISVDAGPNPAPSADMWRKMANPPGTKFPIVPTDPDKAVRIDSPNGVYPTLSYERGGWLVVTRILGATTADAETWYGKLIKLKRIP